MMSDNEVSIPVDFSRGGVMDFRCNKCGSTRTSLRAVFSDTWQPDCCGVKMEKISKERYPK